MNELVQSLIFYVISYSLIIAIGYMVLEMLTHGFIFKFVRVKASRGNRVLLIVHGITQAHFKVGKIESDFLVYKGSDKVIKRVPVKREHSKRLFGLDVFELDNEGRFINKDFEVVQAYDHAKIENLFQRILLAPKNEEIVKILKLIGIGVVICILLVLVVGFIAYKNSEAIRVLGTIASNTI